MSFGAVLVANFAQIAANRKISFSLYLLLLQISKPKPLPNWNPRFSISLFSHPFLKVEEGKRLEKCWSSTIYWRKVLECKVLELGLDHPLVFFILFSNPCEVGSLICSLWIPMLNSYFEYLNCFSYEIEESMTCCSQKLWFSVCKFIIIHG